MLLPPPSNRQHLSFDDCLEVSKKNNQNFFVLFIVYDSLTAVHNAM